MITNKTEKMTNTDITKKIQEIYKIDVNAIRNLSKLANDLTLNGNLVVPGSLIIKGGLKVDREVSVGNKVKIKPNGEIHGRDIHSTTSLKINQTLLKGEKYGMLGIVTPALGGKASGGTVVIGSYNTWGRIWEYKHGRIALQTANYFRGKGGPGGIG
tara:strand:+ start:107 stop:577 length:471 start_codon:yes stop_codon:yes gene_type:complete